MMCKMKINGYIVLFAISILLISNIAFAFPVTGRVIEISASETKISYPNHLFVTDDSSPPSDVIILQDIVNNFKSELEDNYKIKLLSEIANEDLNYRVTVFIYKGQALIIVGANSPVEHVKLSYKIYDYLKNNKNIVAIQKISSKITSKDLRQELSYKVGSLCTSCEGGIDTGQKDDYGCPIYSCPTGGGGGGGVSCSICVGGIDTGKTDDYGCTIYSCPTCTACADGTPTGEKDEKGC